MNDTRFLPIAVLCLLLVACSAEGNLSGTPQEGDCPIGFSTSVEEARETRGTLTTADLRSMGVFAYYTGSMTWNTSHKPNFMFNEQVTRGSSSASWTYSPVKFWPNNPNDKISFFAYAPTDATGVSPLTTATSSYPVLTYTVPTTIALQTDLLAATPLMNKTQSTTALSFQMKHVMTRVLVKAKCTQTITINSVQLNEARGTGNLTLNGNLSWSIGNTSANFTHSTATTVSNSTKDVAEFFMLPYTGKSLTVTFSNSGTTETKTVQLPTSPAWEKGKTITYTLNIEVDSEVTLTVRSWDTNSTTGNMGQDAPSGTTYPYVLNSVAHESATKSYYVGATLQLWKGWEDSKKYCENTYNTGRFPAREWRLPDKEELKRIMNYKDVITSTYLIANFSNWYWAANEYDASKAYCAYGRPTVTVTPTDKTAGHNQFCIRDMGEITVYPTLRQTKDGYYIAYVDPSTKISIDFEYKTLAEHGGGYRLYPSAEERCKNLNKGGYSWRLPEKAEIENLIQHVDILKGSIVWTQTSYNGNTGSVWIWHRNGNWSSYSKTSTTLDAIAPCVRSN